MHCHSFVMHAAFLLRRRPGFVFMQTNSRNVCDIDRQETHCMDVNSFFALIRWPSVRSQTVGPFGAWGQGAERKLLAVFRLTKLGFTMRDFSVRSALMGTWSSRNLIGRS